jgi:hypothetical protein
MHTYICIEYAELLCIHTYAWNMKELLCIHMHRICITMHAYMHIEDPAYAYI